MANIDTGLVGTATTVVITERTASAIGSGLVPVFATPMLVALLEMAAVNALAGHLSATETSVGTRVDVAHLAATPLGMTVRATAVLEKVEGRLLSFRVEAWDDREKIAEGTHVRAIVATERFLAKVEGKSHGQP